MFKFIKRLKQVEDENTRLQESVRTLRAEFNYYKSMQNNAGTHLVSLQLKVASLAKVQNYKWQMPKYSEEGWVKVNDSE